MTNSNYRDSEEYKTQKAKVMAFLKDKLATASMVEVATGVHHKCITWIKRDLEENGYLWEVVKKPCDVTGRNAWWITCDPTLKPINPQYKLFGW